MRKVVVYWLQRLRFDSASVSCDMDTHKHTCVFISYLVILFLRLQLYGFHIHLIVRERQMYTF